MPYFATPVHESGVSDHGFRRLERRGLFGGVIAAEPVVHLLEPLGQDTRL